MGSVSMVQPTSPADDPASRTDDVALATGVPRIEAYEVDDGTVIFDGFNPLAWIHSSDPIPLYRVA